MSHSANPSAGLHAPLLPSLAVTLRGQRCCDNQDGVAGPSKAQHSSWGGGGGEIGDSNPQTSPPPAILNPSLHFGLQGQCHHHEVPKEILPPCSPRGDPATMCPIIPTVSSLCLAGGHVPNPCSSTSDGHRFIPQCLASRIKVLF